MDERIFKLKGKTMAIIDWANVYGWFGKLKWAIDSKKLYDYLKSYREIYDIRFYFGIEKGNEKSEEFHREMKKIGFNVISKEVKWVPVYLEKSYFKEKIKKLHKVLLKTVKNNQNFSMTLLELIKDIDNATDRIHFGMSTTTGEPGFFRATNLETREIYQKILDLNNEIQSTTKIISETLRDFKKPIYRRKCDFDVEITMDILNHLHEIDGIILFSGDGDYKPIVVHILDNKKQAIVIHPYGLRGKEFNELLLRKTNRPFFYPAEKLKRYLK